MNDTNTVKTVIFLYSLILFLVSFVSGKSIDDNLFRWVSGATSAVVLLYIAYEKWVWKWSIFKYISEFYGIPIIHGTWKGRLQYEKDANGKSGEIDIYLSIRQTLFSVKVDSFVTTSDSYSLISKLEESSSNRKQLVFLYRSAAPYGKRDNNRPHDGACVLKIIGLPVKGLKGSYFTDRKGAGTVKLKEYNEQISETYDQAVQRQYRVLN